jgi:hypothetical protein
MCRTNYGRLDMHIYRCFFLGEDDHIKAAEIIQVDVIGEAVHKALVMLRERPEHRTVELWEGERKLYRADEPVRSDRT